MVADVLRCYPSAVYREHLHPFRRVMCQRLCIYFDTTTQLFQGYAQTCA